MFILEKLTNFFIIVKFLNKIEILCCWDFTNHSFIARAAAAKTSEDWDCCWLVETPVGVWGACRRLVPGQLTGYIWWYIWDWVCICVRSCGHWVGIDAGLARTTCGVAGLKDCCRGCDSTCCSCSLSALTWYLLTRANASFVKSRQRCRVRGWRACNIQSTQACFSSLPWLTAASIFAVRSVCHSSSAGR